jgi:hypothetical protein
VEEVLICQLLQTPVPGSQFVPQQYPEMISPEPTATGVL